ncbi:MAG: acetate--CoA ligase family protein [Candidatus Aminicenantales bacterium]
MISHRQYGFQDPKKALAKDAKEAVYIAREIGFPVALKIASPDILHKTDVGGVVLGLDSGKKVKSAFSEMMTNVRKAVPQAHVEGITVEEMCEKGVEIIIGLTNDCQFGPVIMFGLGGIFTEVLDDVSFRVLPISPEDAHGMIYEVKGHTLLHGYRGKPPVDEKLLVELILSANSMGVDLAPRLDSVDLNPIMVWSNQHRVLDAKIILKPEEQDSIISFKPNLEHINTFFKAKSVAIVGASAISGKIGNSVLESIVKSGFKGKVFPINPTRKQILNLPAFPNLMSVPSDIELVVAVVDLAQIPDMLKEIAAKEIHNLVIVSGGGKELGGRTKEVESEIKKQAQRLGIRVVGPNCIGVFDGISRLDTFFQIRERMLRPPSGKVAMITQSGTVGCSFLEKATFGVSKFVSYGNRVDVDEADLLSYLADDAETGVIACYVEGFDHGRKFLEAAKQVAIKKPVIIFKAGRSPDGARASVSHTGFFGGSHKICRGAFRQAKLIEMNSIEELLAAAKALAMLPRSRGGRIAMVSNGAGAMVQAIDLLEEYNLTMPVLHHEIVKELKRLYPPFYIVQNPLDITGSATSEDYRIGIQALISDSSIDLVMPWFVFQDTPLDEKIIDVLADLLKSNQKPIVCGAMGGPYTERISKAIESEGVPVFMDVRQWLAAAKALSFQII